MSKITIYHNNRCSKSRQCLAYLSRTSAEIEIIDYVKNPLSEAEIVKLLQILKISPMDLIRKNEPEWKENENKNLSDNQLILLMVQNPKLIERPIVVKNGEGIIARPPEKVLEWL